MESTYAVAKSPDSYEAGICIAEKIKSVNPEIVFIFFSIHYSFNEFFDAFYQVIDSKNIIVYGGTGDGVYSQEGVLNNGISAVGVNSNGKIKWMADIENDLYYDSYKKASSVVDKVLSKLDGVLKAGILLSDFKNDGVAVAEAVGEKINAPYCGGLTGDDWQFEKGFVILNGKLYADAVSFLGLSGDFEFTANCASGWKPIGNPGVVQEVKDNIVKYIDGKTAYDFIEDEFGIPPAEAELGVIPLAVFDDTGKYFLRTSSNIDIASGFIKCFGSIPVNSEVKVCNATKEDVINGASEAVKCLNFNNFKPLFGIVISCGGRKWILQDEISKEINLIKEKFGVDFPFTGFASFGEFGAFWNCSSGFSKTYFHNVTFSIMVIGEKIEV